MLLSSTVRDDNATMTCDLANPDLHSAGGELILEHDLIHIRRSRFLWRASCFEHLSIQNFDALPRRLNLEISFHADFADLFEVRGALRPQHGTYLPTKNDESNVILAYSGLDGQRRETHLRFSPEPSALSAETAVFELDIGPGERCIIFMEIRCGSKGSASTLPRNFFMHCGMRVARFARPSLEAGQITAVAHGTQAARARAQVAKARIAAAGVLGEREGDRGTFQT
jgi:glycogen debranching enzyme